MRLPPRSLPRSLSRSLPWQALLLAGLLSPALAWGDTSYPKVSGFGVPFSKDEAWYRQCVRVEHKQAPPLPSTSAPADCHAETMYYTALDAAGTTAADWRNVAACAQARQDHGVLMMLYANGFGVERDRDLAIQHACSLDFSAKAEMEGRIAHLAGADDAGKPFDLCDDITSGRMGADCAAIGARRAASLREWRLKRIAGSLAPAPRAAFLALRTAAVRYAGAGAGEIDMQGTGAPARSIERKAALEAEFMQAVQDTLDGKLPPASAADYADSDRRLNELYRQVMSAPSRQPASPDRIGDATITHADVREAQRHWLSYRNAFHVFVAMLGAKGGVAANPVAADTLLTRQRSARLEDIARWR